MAFPSAVSTDLELLIAKNNTMVVLDVSCAIGDTSITVDDASALPDSGYLTFVDTDEVIYYSSRTGTVLSGVTRGADSTAAAAHTAGVDLEMRWNVAYRDRVVDELQLIEQYISDEFDLGTTHHMVLANGTALSPSLRFASPSHNTGIYRSAEDSIGFSADGSLTAHVDVLGITVDSGRFFGPTNSLTLPTYTIAADTNSGLGFAGSDSIALTTGGVAALTVNSSQQITIPKTSNQLILGTTNTVTVSSTAPAASRTYTIPDAGGAANFLLSGWAQIVNADISASADIAWSKLVAGSANRIRVGNASGVMVDAAAITASRLLVSDANGIPTHTSVTTTEAGYLSGVTSAIQTQLDARVLDTGDTITGDITMDNQKAIKFRESTGSGTNAVTVKAVATMSADYTILLPASAPTANGQVVKVKDYTTGEWEFGTGGGQGGINYITNYDAETDTTGWATYADAAGTSPVDGTAGSPTVAISRVTSSPLRGTGMFRITKDAANRQGEGCSYAFTIDAADKAKVLQIEFDYNPSSAFVSGDSSDIRVWVYDVTNTVLIPVAPYTIQGGNGANHKFIGIFQTASNSTSYRLIFHVATTNASAWTFDFDNVKVGPQVTAYGAPVTDWASYTPTLAGLSVSSSVAYWRRVGDSMEIFYRAVSSGAVSTTITVSLPSGYSIDTTKVSNSEANAVGIANGSDDNGSFYTGTVRVSLSSTTTLDFTGPTTSSRWNSTVPFTWASPDVLSFRAMVPIAGWSSTVLMSNDADTRVVALKYTGNSNGAMTADVTAATFLTKVYDTHSAWNGTQFTAPVSGYYNIRGCFRITASNSFNVYDYIDGVAGNIMNHNSSTNIKTFAGQVFLRAGQVLTIRIDTSSTQEHNNANHWIAIEKISGPSAIAATETVAARYSTAAAPSIADNSATVINFATKDFDTHGAVTTGAAWVFTAPVSGLYDVHATAMLATGGGWAAGEQTTLYIFKNGSTYGYDIWHSQATHTTSPGSRHVNGKVKLLPGDTIQIKIYQNSGGSIALDADAKENYVEIVRVGNY